jgi:hypothetical protein
VRLLNPQKHCTGLQGFWKRLQRAQGEYSHLGKVCRGHGYTQVIVSTSPSATEAAHICGRSCFLIPATRMNCCRDCFGASGENMHAPFLEQAEPDHGPVRGCFSSQTKTSHVVVL